MCRFVKQWYRAVENIRVLTFLSRRKATKIFKKKKKDGRITENIQTVGACWDEKSWKTRIRERQIVDSYVTFEETFFFFNWFNDTCTPMDPFPLIINIRKFGKAGREKLEERV